MTVVLTGKTDAWYDSTSQLNPPTPVISIADGRTVLQQKHYLMITVKTCSVQGVLTTSKILLKNHRFPQNVIGKDASSHISADILSMH